jgi:hypothetical protein
MSPALNVKRIVIISQVILSIVVVSCWELWNQIQHFVLKIKPNYNLIIVGQQGVFLVFNVYIHIYIYTHSYLS